MKKLSVIVPCYNEEESIELFYDSIIRMWSEKDSIYSKYQLELVLINDGSKDGTDEIVKELSGNDSRVRYTSFARNFGKEAAIFCGLKQATGEAAVIIDADLQHPLATIGDMLKKWEEGYEIVEGVKADRGNESKSHGLVANLFYKIISKLTGFDMKNSSDFKLISRRVIDTLNDMTEKETFFRALTFWTGYKSTSVSYEVQDRVAGCSKWSTKSLISYAVKNIIAFTYTPLYLIFFAGIVVLLLGIGFGIDALITFIKGEAVGGYPSLVLIITIATGGIMLSLGIIATYIAKIYQEVKNRPKYIVMDTSADDN